MKQLWIFLAGILLPLSGFAANVNCPSNDAVKSAKFTQAFANPYRSGVWYFFSDVITENGYQWNVWFGAVLTTAKTPLAALKEGQDYFNQSSLSAAEFYVDKNTVICSYVRQGMPYFVTALNPPKYDPPLHPPVF